MCEVGVGDDFVGGVGEGWVGIGVEVREEGVEVEELVDVWGDDGVVVGVVGEVGIIVVEGVVGEEEGRFEVVLNGGFLR